MNLASRFSRHASTTTSNRLDREISLTCRGIQRRIGGDKNISRKRDSQFFLVFLQIVIYHTYNKKSSKSNR